MYFKNLNILVTGSTGFIGRNLLQELYNKGANISAIVNKNNTLSVDCNIISYDGSYQSLINNLKETKIDVIIHLATCFIANHKPEDVDRLIDSNILFGCHLLELTKEKQIPYFINTSTYAQYYDNLEYNPQNLYSATKQAFEDLLKFYEQTLDSTFLTLELTDTFGIGDTRPKFINLLIESYVNKTPFLMSPGEQEICYLYIGDVVNAYIKAIDLLLTLKIKKSSKFSVYSKEVYKLKELAAIVFDILGANNKIELGYYPYRKREIMKFIPKYPKLPNWNCNYSLSEAILELKKEQYEG